MVSVKKWRATRAVCHQKSFFGNLEAKLIQVKSAKLQDVFDLNLKRRCLTVLNLSMLSVLMYDLVTGNNVVHIQKIF